MEDEEYLPEKSDLRLYLESLRLCDAYEDDATKKKNSNLSLPWFKSTNAKNKNECIDKDIIDQIEELLSARMLFEEDVNNIERLLSNFKVIKTGMLRSIFENVSGFIVIVLGLCLYWAIGSYVFYLISIYYAYYAADYLYTKYFNQKRLKTLVTVMQENYYLFKKTLKFINDSDNILNEVIRGNPGLSADLTGECELYLNLKNEFARAENEIITILSSATKKLIKNFPFYEYVENPNYYLCNRYEQILDCMDVAKLYQVYLLVQSEFIQRLALTLIPNIKASHENNCYKLYKIIKETSLLLKKLELRFDKKFKIVFLRGVYDSKKNTHLNLHKKVSSDPEKQYKNEFISNIQDMSNSFQRLLVKSRTIESNFFLEKTPDQVENQLISIQNELDLCQRNISDSYIVLKKFSSEKSVNEKNCVQQDITDDSTEEENSPIDLSAQEDLLQDVIYEAYLTGEHENKGEEEELDYNDYTKRKLEREYSKLVLEELKSKIAEKADFLKMKEAKSIIKKIGYRDQNANENSLTDYESSNANENVNNNECVTSVVEDKTNSESHLSEHIREGYALHLPENNFLADIVKARAKLMKNPLSEEYFCLSDQDSDGAVTD